MYNVLAKLRSGEALNAKEKTIHEMGLVSVLKTLHDELDLAVLDAYGWSDLAPLLHTEAFTEPVLERLVALNAERAREEAGGLVRWLRPEYQNPAAKRDGAGSTAATPVQAALPDAVTAAETDAEDAANESGTPTAPKAATTPTRKPWPPSLPEQMAAVAQALAEAGTPLSEPDLAARFTGKGPWKKRLPEILQTLVALGRARQIGGQWNSL
jgi:hypothetical protein